MVFFGFPLCISWHYYYGFWPYAHDETLLNQWMDSAVNEFNPLFLQKKYYEKRTIYYNYTYRRKY